MKERRRGVILNQWPQWKGIIFWFRSGILCIFWLPGTSANCLQCLSLCLLGVCVRRFLWDTHCRRLWLARTRHTRWCYYYASGLFRLLSTLVSPFGSFFPPHDKHCLLDWCYWLSRLVSHLMWTPPPIVVFVWRPQNVSKSSFLHLSVKCKEWRMLMSMVCVVRDEVKRVWESIETHDLTPSFFYF